MKKIIITAAVLLLASYGAIAQSQSTDNLYEYAIQVSGKAEKKITPDQIYMNVVIKDGDVKNLNVNQIESSMKSHLTVLGVDVAKDLKVSDMTNAPKKKNQVDTKRSYELKVADVGMLNSIFEMLGELNISEANVVRVSHSKIEDFRKEVRMEAIRTAKTNAEEIAQAIGQDVGPAVYIYDNGNMFENYDAPMFMRANKMATRNDYYNDGAETTIDFKDITLSYSITAKFVLKLR